LRANVWMRVVSAPAVGDQSVAFTRTETVTIQGQSLTLTLDEIRFRVGSVLGKVGTAGPAGNGALHQTVALAQAVVGHERAQG